MFVVSVLLSACARGVAEFQLYTQAFNAQYEQGDAILNSVARAERVVVRGRIAGRGAIPNFDPNKAAYFVDNVDPPITGSIRASLKSLKSYNDALGALANGEAATALSNRVGVLATNIVGALAASEAAFGFGGVIPGADQMVAKFTSQLNIAAPIIKEVAIISTREAFRHQLIAAYPAMRDLLVTMRDGTPAMFNMLRTSRVVRGSQDYPEGIPPEGAAALERDRALLAGWVLLLDKSLVAMQAAVVAAMTDLPNADLASLAEASLELRVLAEQVKSLRIKP
jgi:hypothetical protein